MNKLTTTKPIPPNLQAFFDFVYTTCGTAPTNVCAGTESMEYRAYTFKLMERYVHYREAKITPTKVGQFVTLWKRKLNGPIQPFELSDTIELVIVSARIDGRFGLFIFPKSALLDNGILSGNNKEGKRAFRIYPPWDTTLNKQAQKAQQWQLDYFLDLSVDNKVDLKKDFLSYINRI